MHRYGTLECLTLPCRNFAEGFWTIAVPYVRCSALLTRCRKLGDHCGALRCIAVHCQNVAEGLRATVELAVHCGTVQKHCGRAADHRSALRTLWKAYGPLWCVPVSCGALRTVHTTLSTCDHITQA